MTSIVIDPRWAVFADPLRARIVALLLQEQLCTCHLVEETGAKQSTISHHLKVLREAGLVETEPRGRYTYYRLAPEAFDEMSASLRRAAERARTAADVRRPC